MNIVFVIFQTGNQANGGVESITQVIEHSPHLRSQVVTQLDTPLIERWRAAGAAVTLWSLPYPIGTGLFHNRLMGTWRRFTSLVSTNLQMYRLVRQTQATIAHLNDPSAFWHSVFGAKLAGAAVVFNIRDTKAADEPYGLKWAIAVWLSTCLLVLSQEMRESLLAALPAARRQPSKIRVIYSIVNSDVLQPVSAEARAHLRQRLGIPPDAIAVGDVATLNAKKAQLTLLEAAGAQLQQAIPNLQFYFIGDCEPEKNDYARQCLAAVERLGLAATFHFTGYTPAVADWYRALDMVVVASRKEGLARCMIESLACGTPVVFFAVCSAREILEQFDCGRVVPEGDYDGLTTAIATLARQPELRSQLGRNGVEAVKRCFQPEAIAHDYVQLYQALTPAPSGLPRTLTDRAAPNPRGQAGNLSPSESAH